VNMAVEPVPGTGPAIAFGAVSLSLGGTDILCDIRLELSAGRTHALVGPNGGGKSSLVKALLGQMPHQGKIAMTWPGEAGNVGYVPQALEFERGLPMTVEDVLATMVQTRPGFLGLARRHRELVDTALARVGLSGKRRRRMGALSGGERQRVLLAQALMPQADLLVLDEPLAALDEAGIGLFESLLGQWQAEGRTVVWIEHDLAAVRRLADTVTGLNRKLLFHETPEQALAPEWLINLFSHSATETPRVAGEVA